METTYQYNADKAVEKLQRLKEIKGQKISFEMAQKAAYLEGYQTAIDDTIAALIRWEKNQ